MTRPVCSRIVLFSALALLAVVLAGGDRAVIGQDKEADVKPAAAQKVKKFRGRLPAYYRLVVDEKQRQAIYAIQEEYAPKIADLRAQLEAQIKQRDEKVAAVLTPEQLKKVEDAKAAAKAKRSQKKSAK